MARTTHRKTKPPIVPLRDIGFGDVLATMERRERTYDPQFLRTVYEFAEQMHRDQVRRSGEPYMSHPTYVSYILADLNFDEICVAVGFLHDVLEDTRTTKDELTKRFGADVAELVDGVSKISRQSYVRRDEAQAETFRKMILASARDLRVILVKTADRLHNMMTLEHMPPEKRRRISAETLEIYAPIALRLGMSKVQGDLEDLAFYYRYPLQFTELEAEVSEKMKVAKSSIERIRGKLAKSLGDAGIEADISYRVKRFYSIYRKLRRQGIDISQLYDFLAFRVITEDLKDTYAAFGIVHQSWRPIPGRFKDYIAMPKPNLYQSLHTTVVGNKGQPFEVQIRTREMDLIAEEGIAAHWQYKEGKTRAKTDKRNVVWLRQLLEWQQDIQDPREFLSALKIDLYPDEVYAFTPKGDVYAFPRGATPLDFAYRIHTDLGHHCSGARVNGKLVPLKTALKNGDIVEIISGTNRKPSRDWLNFVVTSRARQKIRHWINTQQKLESQGIGRRMLERALKKAGASPRKVLDSKPLHEYLKNEGLSKVEELYQRLGYGKTPIKHVLSKLLDKEEVDTRKRPSAWERTIDRIMPGGGPVTVRGEGNLMATLAKCCRPVPGEELIGYVTRGRGISVHSVDCPNVKNLIFDPARLIEVEWERGSEGIFPVTLSIRTEDHQGILARLTEVIAREASNIRQFEADTIDDHGQIDVVVEVKNRRHLDKLRQAIHGVKGVIQVSRRMSGSTPGGSLP